ncbi:hypothetical protein [Aliivibrio fischeri]|uniref:hypothetical protein n=1 Tax=Aliivibrio fischeri TaxID=668 RepID=UPI00080EC1BF|nr:hypothetical protein [Aliivibrio fischeri]OCH02167.1 hypothetical protein A6E09_18550 [Aliivibrio fischeri]
MTQDVDKKSFIDRFDADDKLIAKGKILTTVSLILLALEVSGATMKEANTFIFKIEFAHQNNIAYLLLAAVVYLTIRYRNYAKPYHNELFLLWSERMMNNKDVFHYSHREEAVKGLLGGAFDICGDDEPGIKHSTYEVSGFLHRGINYPTVFRGESGDGEWIEEYYDEYFSLLSFNKKWTASKYLRLLFIEFKYRLSSFINDREHLDVLSPYMFSGLAILSVLIPWELFT